MPSSDDSSASIVTSWLIKVPQKPEDNFGPRHAREIKGPGGIGAIRSVSSNSAMTRRTLWRNRKLPVPGDAVGSVEAFKHPKMPSSDDSSASIVTSWLIKAPQKPEDNFGSRHTREIKVPEVLGDTIGTSKIRDTPKSAMDLFCAARIM
jgi:hypothetical protein